MKNSEKLKKGLRIRRSQVRILPGAPAKSRGYGNKAITPFYFECGKSIKMWMSILGDRRGLPPPAKVLISAASVSSSILCLTTWRRPDYPWGSDHPEYFVLGNAGDANNDPESFAEMRAKVFACGRDPFFPAWLDVLQLNAFQPELRQAVIETT